MNLHNTSQTVRPSKGIVGKLQWHGTPISMHNGYLERRARERDQEWEPYSHLALAILAQAVEDAMGTSRREGRNKADVIRDREDAILLLRSMDGGCYQDRLSWLEIAHPRSDSRAMDQLLQSRLDDRGLPRV